MLVRFVFCIGYGGDDDGLGTIDVRNSAKVIYYAALLLLLQ